MQPTFRPSSPSRLLTRLTRGCAILLLGGITAGCATPADRYDEIAASLGFTRQVVDGDHFQHVVFSQPASSPGGALHVYLDGDGTPWVHNVPSADPTPRQSLVLALAASDPAEVVVVGRPCYHQRTPTLGCQPALWTSLRYGDAVLTSLARAIRAEQQQRGAPELVLIGHSGGGVLAQLVAARLPGVRAVVTIGANLDTAAWVEQRGFEPLEGSLNPASAPPLPPLLKQLHFIGANDHIVAPSSRAGFFDQHPDAVDLRIAEFGHVCCWRSVWPEWLQRALAGAPIPGVIATR